MTLKIAVAGCAGRMGLTLVKAVLSHPDAKLVAGSERPGFDEQAALAQLETVGCKQLFITSNPDVLVGEADAILDFTSPESSLTIAKAAAKLKRTHIIGTTGFTDVQKRELSLYAQEARIVQSGNFSIGVNLLEKLVEQTARMLDDSYDIEIFEMHHKHKKDAPSGTALMLGEAVAAGRGVKLKDKKVTGRDGMHGERKQGDIGFMAARGGDVVGIHSVMFAGSGEVIEIKHQGFNRDIYASGALKAAFWAKDQKAGLYSMKDVLGLS